MGASDLRLIELRPDQKDFLLRTARRSMEAAVRKQPRPPSDTGESPGTGVIGGADLRKPSGAFCTLTMAGELRGCVGFFEPVHPLVETISRASVKAALEDHRFSPVTEAELGLIRIELSVLSEMEPVRSLSGIVVGRDGLFLEAGSVRGLLLPQVATENAWDAQTFLLHVFRKCGLSPSPIDTPGIALSRFEAEVFSEPGPPGGPATAR